MITSYQCNSKITKLDKERIENQDRYLKMIQVIFKGRNEKYYHIHLLGEDGGWSWKICQTILQIWMVYLLLLLCTWLCFQYQSFNDSYSTLSSPIELIISLRIFGEDIICMHVIFCINVLILCFWFIINPIFKLRFSDFFIYSIYVLVVSCV